MSTVQSWKKANRLKDTHHGTKQKTQDRSKLKIDVERRKGKSPRMNRRTPEKGSPQSSIPKPRRNDSEENLQTIVDDLIERIQNQPTIVVDHCQGGDTTQDQPESACDSEQEEIDKRDTKNKLGTDEETKLKTVCSFLSGSYGAKPTLKQVVKDEIQRPLSDFDLMMRESKLVTAFGRRLFDESDMISEAEEDDEDDAYDHLKPRDHHHHVVESKYMKVFEKKEDQEKKNNNTRLVTKKAENVEAIKENPSNFGLWDKALDPVSVVTKLEKRHAAHLKRESSFDEQIRSAQMKAKLKAEEDESDDTIISSATAVMTLKDHPATAKYLLESDIAWCQKFTRFGQRDIIKWFKRYRSASPKGRMTKDELKTVYGKIYYKGGDAQCFVDTVFKLYGLEEDNKDALDFKDFLYIMEVTTWKTAPEKLRWMFQLLGTKSKFPQDDMECILTFFDQLQYQRKDEDYDNLSAAATERRPSLVASDFLMMERTVEDRLEELHKNLNITRGYVSKKEFEALPPRMILARDF